MICMVTINCPECGCKNTANLDDRELTIEYRCKECGSERTMQLKDFGVLRNIMEE